MLTLRLNHHEIPVQVAKGIDSKGRKADVQSITGIEIEKYGEILPGKLRHKRRRGAVLTLSKEAGHTNSVFEKLEFVDAKVVDVDVVIISAMLASARGDLQQNQRQRKKVRHASIQLAIWQCSICAKPFT